MQLLPAVQKTSLTGSPFLLTVVDGTISCNLPDLYSSCFCLRFWPPFSSETLAGVLKIKWPQPRQLKYRMSTAYAATVRFALRFAMVPSDNVILHSVQIYTYIINILLLDSPCMNCQNFGVSPLVADVLVLEWCVTCPWAAKGQIRTSRGTSRSVVSQTRFDIC